MATDGMTQGIPQAVKQVPSVRDLNCVRCTTAGAVSIKTRTITGHNLDPRPAFQPASNTVGVTIRKQIKHAIALQIADNRSISLAATPSPVVDPDDSRSSKIR